MPTSKKLNIVSVAAEVAPFSKTGGLGDVARALPMALEALGHKVSVITPYYTFIDQQRLSLEDIGIAKVRIGPHSYKVTFYKSSLTPKIPVYFVRYDRFFGHSKIYEYDNDNLRFYLFNEAVLKLIKLINLKPDLIHCHDWHTGLIPNLIKTTHKNDSQLSRISTLYTIHNLPFQFGMTWWKVPANKIDYGRGKPPIKLSKIKYINFTKRAIIYADVINTVSERYAHEILTPEFGQGLDKHLDRRHDSFFGIINGIDYTVYNPSFDTNLDYNYDWNSLDKKKRNKMVLQKELKLAPTADQPLIGLVNRLTEQKGFYMILEILPILMKQRLQMVVVGSGDQDFISQFKKYAKRFPKQLAIYTPFTEKMASRVYAGSDIFLMPSRYEPCGISQMISLRYGSIPIVHETGGLSDTITNYNPRTGRGNGFVFTRYEKEELLITIARAIENYHHTKTWERLTWQSMRLSYSWKLPAQKYTTLYRLAIKKRKSKKK
ncbi:MAG: glycogen synthase [Patescibacteria group bacterium]